MRLRLALRVAALVMALGCAYSLRAQALTPEPEENPAPPPVKSQPADLTGIWRRSQRPPDKLRQYTVFELAMSLTTEEPPMTPWGMAKYKAAKPNLGPHAYSLAQTNDPVTKCFPPGVPRIYLQRLGPFEIIQTPGRVLMFFEYEHFIRQIYTDGRQHSPDLNPSWMGDAVGRWEGSTLVADTIGFNDKTWLDYVGHPHSEALHLTERMRRDSHASLGIDFTIDDPKAYTMPWSTHKDFDLKPDWKIEEVVCADNFNFDQLRKLTEAKK